MTTPFDSFATPNPNAGIVSLHTVSSPDPDQPPQTQAFPSPQTFTILPQLYTLISRLAPLQAHSQSQPNTGTSTNPSRPSRSPTLTRRPAPGTTISTTSSDQHPTSGSGGGGGGGDGAFSVPLSLTQTRSRDETIEIKDLPALVYPLRQQIERAREVVKAMPDVYRNLGEQEAEIRRLEESIGGLKMRLNSLAGLAAGQREKEETVDVVMQGIEG